MKKVLLVDDEVIIIKHVSRFLQSKGFNTSIVGNGSDALKKYRQEKYDFVLLDLFMKPMSGLEILKNLKEIDSNVKVFMITASEKDEGYCDESKALGAKGYIMKPLDASKISRLAEYLLTWSDEKNMGFLVMGRET